MAKRLSHLPVVGLRAVATEIGQEGVDAFLRRRGAGADREPPRFGGCGRHRVTAFAEAASRPRTASPDAPAEPAVPVRPDADLLLRTPPLRGDAAAAVVDHAAGGAHPAGVPCAQGAPRLRRSRGQPRTGGPRYPHAAAPLSVRRGDHLRGHHVAVAGAGGRLPLRPRPGDRPTDPRRRRGRRPARSGPARRRRDRARGHGPRNGSSAGSSTAARRCSASPARR